MSRHYDADGLCRYCRRLDGEHRASCVLAAEPPLADEPAFNAYLCDRDEDAYVNAMIGEPGGVFGYLEPHHDRGVAGDR